MRPSRSPRRPLTVPPEALRAAAYATLNATPVTPEAEGFCAEVVRAVQGAQERDRALRGERLAAFEALVAGLVADFLLSPADGRGLGMVYRSSHAKWFSGSGTSVTHYKKARAAMERLGLVEKVADAIKVKGKEIDWGDTGQSVIPGGMAARYRATATLREMATAALGEDDWDEHFTQPRTHRLISLRAASRRTEDGRKIKGVTMPIRGGDDDVERIRAQVADLNDFLGSVAIGGPRFIGFYRGFEKGDAAGFNWDKGGRLYAEGPDNYQQAKKVRRLEMTLDGSAVAEIDVQASFLSILHGLLGAKLPPGDPYQVPNVDRVVVKTWINSTLGQGRFPERWSPRHTSEYRARTGRSLTADFPLRQVQDRIVAALPVLAQVEPQRLDWADLMFVESEAIIAALLRLKEHGVPALPVHDSLIVPDSAVALAKATLREAFQAKAGVTPGLEVRRGIPSPSSL